MQAELLAAMRQSVVDGAPDTASALARTAVSEGHAPLEIIDAGYVSAMQYVGEQYAQRSAE